MAGWENFYIAELGASAALAGLVFVGLLINLTKILSFGTLPSRAFEALVVLLAVLFMLSLLLVPGQPRLIVGAEVLLVGLIDWTIIAIIQVNYLRKTDLQIS